MRFRDLREHTGRRADLGITEVVVDPSPADLRALRAAGTVRALLHPETGRTFAWIGEAQAHHVETKLFLAGLEPKGGTPPSWWRDRHPDDTVYVAMESRGRGWRLSIPEAASHPALRRL